MSLIQKISDPRTFWGRVPAAVYGALWSLACLMAVALVVRCVDGPLALPAGALLALGAFVVTLWVTKA